jgi:hypothetical protein
MVVYYVGLTTVNRILVTRLLSSSSGSVMVPATRCTLNTIVGAYIYTIL